MKTENIKIKVTLKYKYYTAMDQFEKCFALKP